MRIFGQDSRDSMATWPADATRTAQMLSFELQKSSYLPDLDRSFSILQTAATDRNMRTAPNNGVCS